MPQTSIGHIQFNVQPENLGYYRDISKVPLLYPKSRFSVPQCTLWSLNLDELNRPHVT